MSNLNNKSEIRESMLSSVLIVHFVLKYFKRIKKFRYSADSDLGLYLNTTIKLPNMHLKELTLWYSSGIQWEKLPIQS